MSVLAIIGAVIGGLVLIGFVLLVLVWAPANMSRTWSEQERNDRRETNR